jgi:predicted transcriptional regulator
MTDRRILQIDVSTLKGFLEQFARTWDKAERGEDVAPYQGIGFESMSQLLGILTPQRRQLAERLRKHGPMPLAVLATVLGRDVDHVRQDEALARLGIVRDAGDGNVEVSWDEIEARLKLAA